MSKLFISVLNMSFTAGYCILVVIALRLLLRRLPKLLSYLLWGVVLFRLLCPVSISGDYSLLRVNTHMLSAESIAAADSANDKNSGEVYASYNGNAAIPDSAKVWRINDAPQADIRDMTKLPRIHTVINAASWLWLSVIALLILRSIISAVKLRRFLSDAVRIEDNIYEKEGIGTPFVMGIIAPRIYLPPYMSESERKYVLAHEKIHIKRKDYAVKLLAYAAACIHWFNPLVWLAFSLMEKDMEMSCDEAVLKKMGMDNKENYSRTLLSLSSEAATLSGNPIAFSERKVEERIRNILSYRRKALLTVIMTASVIVAVSLGLAINPKTEAGAGKLYGGSESNAEAGNVPTFYSKAPAALNTFIQNYAEAFCNRDGKTIASLYADESAALADWGDMLLEKTEDGYSFGWSSPWPFSNDYRYLINEDSQTADIWFYAITSDPHVSVWKQKIHYAEADGEYYLTKSAIQLWDSISDKSEYDEAYLIGGEYNFIDYMENGFAEAVTFHIKEGNSPFDYTVYGEPETAAEYILNLTGGTGTAQRASNGKAVVEYTFADGSSVLIPMIDANFDGQTQTDNGSTANMSEAVNYEVWVPDLSLFLHFMNNA